MMLSDVANMNIYQSFSSSVWVKMDSFHTDQMKNIKTIHQVESVQKLQG